MPDRETLDLLAACLEYPTGAMPASARAAAERTAGDHIAVAHALWDLAVWLETARPGEPEERYTALFDLNPVCTLHVGYQVFGDTYPRGAFIAGLASEIRKAGLARGHDLPDFLPTVLRLLGRVSADDADTLTGTVVVPALGRMAQALAETTCPWADVLRALPAYLTDEPAAALETPAASAEAASA